MSKHSSQSNFTDSGDLVDIDVVIGSDQNSTDDYLHGDEDSTMAVLSDSSLGTRAGRGEDPYSSGDEPIDIDFVAPVAKRGPKSALLKPPPIDPNGPPVSVYQRLVDYGLLRKMTDIVLAKVATPWHLRADASQEVHTAWVALIAKPNFARNQLCRYAYMSGQHAALKLRRTIGAVVVIPGALFRTGRDSSFMEAIGAAVNPRDVDDYRDSLDLSVEPSVELMGTVNEGFFQARLSRLTLSAKQRTVARKALIERLPVDQIAEELDMPPMYVERLMNQISQKLVDHDDASAALGINAVEVAASPPSDPPARKGRATKPCSRVGPPASRASKARKPLINKES